MSELNEPESLFSLLCNEKRDFLIRNDQQEVKVEELEGKHVGLYFSGDEYNAGRVYAPFLSEIYKELSEKGDFEIVFISTDDNKRLFQASLRTIPCLVLPFSDKYTRRKLKRAFLVHQVPTLVVLDKDGRIVTPYGVEYFEEFGIDGYPFTTERVDKVKEKVEALRDSDTQTLESLLVSNERDFVIGHGKGKVAVAELVGKTVALFFSAKWCVDMYDESIPLLIKFYNELLEKGVAFEIVYVSEDSEEKYFQEVIAKMPWLALPLGDKTIRKLFRYFQISTIPEVVIIDPDGKVRWELPLPPLYFVKLYGSKCYPFTKERVDQIEEELKKEVNRGYEYEYDEDEEATEEEEGI